MVTHEQVARRSQANRAVSIVEVSDSSVELDRGMALDYAAALVPDYWLLNMGDRELAVYCDPTPDPTTLVGYRYASHRVRREAESVPPLVRPDAVVAVVVMLRLG